MHSELRAHPETSEKVVFSNDLIDRFQVLVSRYPKGKQKSALLPILHEAQQAYKGWLSVEVMNAVAHFLNIQPIEVYEVATFYTMFRLEPTGKFVLEVCQTGPCCLIGAESIIRYIEKKLGIQVNQTTEDGLFTLKTVECLASCGTGPVLQQGDRYVEHLTEAKIDQLLDELRQLKSGESV